MVVIEPGSIRDMNDFKAALEAVLATAFRHVGHISASGPGRIDLVIDDNDVDEVTVHFELTLAWIRRLLRRCRPRPRRPSTEPSRN
jgi:hypothetical protein